MSWPIAYVELVPGAKTTADEVQAFAIANSPERAAAPKQIILLDKMPLTDVGKAAKVQLRLDAASARFYSRPGGRRWWWRKRGHGG